MGKYDRLYEAPKTKCYGCGKPSTVAYCDVCIGLKARKIAGKPLTEVAEDGTKRDGTGLFLPRIEETKLVKWF